jgi:hypothetical protein
MQLKVCCIEYYYKQIAGNSNFYKQDIWKILAQQFVTYMINKNLQESKQGKH